MTETANNGEAIKQKVKENYGAIAENSGTSCCSSSTSVAYAAMAESYSQLEGYVPEADLGLGCGLPTKFAQIQEGDTVVDLGSGAGNDCFVARHLTGEKGRVIGIDFTDKMIQKARENAKKLKYENVSFVQGDIENIPLPDHVADVVVSNCVLNLVPDKMKAFREIYRILKPGGHFSVSDIVIQGNMPESLKKEVALYTACVSGAIPKEEYGNIIESTGFKGIKIQKEKLINIPEEVVKKYLSGQELEFYLSTVKVLSISWYGEKPL